VNVPATVELASSWVALNAVPYWMAAGAVQLIGGVICVVPFTFSCRTKLLETLPTVAVKVTAWEVATGDTVAITPTLEALAGIVTVAGTVTAVLLVHRVTVIPPTGAAAFSVTVQASDAEPDRDVPVHDRALNRVVSGGVVK
jgi:hypothetical protein